MRSMKVGIAGAGLLGRLLAWQLSRAGHRVSVFDPAAGPRPQFRQDKPAQAPLQAAAFTAAGMLSPLAELDNAEPAVAAMGWRSLALWREITAALPGQPFFAEQGSLLLAHRTDLGTARRVLDRLDHALHSPRWPAGQREDAVRELSPHELREMEPSVNGPSHAWCLRGEGQIDTVAVMQALHDGAAGVDWHWSSPVQEVLPEGGLRLANGVRHDFDWVADLRGLGGRGPDWPLRGVRGEVVWLHAPGHGLRRPLRLLHPRHRLYLVPRPGERVILGASEIESEDDSPVSLRTAVELMAAAHSVVPALAEARIERLDVNLRPALPDNAPRAQWHRQALAINGLFRHGWLLAPALLEQALSERKEMFA